MLPWSIGCGSKTMGSHFGFGAPPILVYFSRIGMLTGGNYGVLTHAQISTRTSRVTCLIGLRGEVHSCQALEGRTLCRKRRRCGS